jgi:hypothetical protein
VKRLAVLLPVLLPGLLLVCCSQPLTIEQIIISRIRTMEAQLEDGERRRFMTNFSEDFRAQNGQMTRDQLRAYVVLQLNRYKKLEARLFPITVQQVSESEVTAKFNALVTGGPGWIPEDGQLYEFNTHWRLVGDEWLLTAAQWEPIAVGELMN